MKYYTLFYVFLLSTIVCYAQNTKYIESFDNKINVDLSLDTNVFSYTINSPTDNSLYELKANESARLALSIHYRFIGVTIGFSPNFLNNNEDEVLKGESAIRLIKLRLFVKQFIQQFEYHKVKGYYVENTGDFIGNWIKDNDPYLKLEDFTTKQYFGKTTYVWNKNFSFKALLVKNEQQIKSTGSFIPSLTYSYNELKNPNNEILKIDQSSFDVNLNAGYIYNFVFGSNNNFFTSLGLSPGVGFKFAKTIEDDNNGIEQSISKTYPNFSIEGRLNLGYNSNKIYTGLQLNTYEVSYNKTPETKIENSRTYLQLYFGYRFSAPKSVEKLFNKIKI